MPDIIDRVQQVQRILEDKSIGAWQRQNQCMMALSGLILSDLNENAKRSVEQHLVAINQFVSTYDTQSDSDEKLTESDLSETLRDISSITELCIDSEAARVMHELVSSGKKLPVSAITEIRNHRDIFIPLLSDAISRSVARIRSGEEIEPDDASIFALLLLTEFEVDDAFPILLDALRLPGEGPFELFGDVVHELVAPALALFSRGDTKEVDELVGDPNVDMFVRWSASKTYKFLVRDGLISRNDGIKKLHRLFQSYVESNDHEMLAPLACELADLAAKTALESIHDAFERGLVDESIVHLEFIETQIARGEDTVKESLEHCQPTGMPDTIIELSRWAFYREDARPPNRTTSEPFQNGSPYSTSIDDEIGQPRTTTIRIDGKVGRNAPCPCGSGKKFKKCCR